MAEAEVGAAAEAEARTSIDADADELGKDGGEKPEANGTDRATTSNLVWNKTRHAREQARTVDKHSIQEG